MRARPTFTATGLFLVTASGLTHAQSSAQTPAGQTPQAKIVTMQGRVERAPAAQERWDAAKVFQELFARERVRTLVASRTAILFIDETQVKLNANAVLTVQSVRKATGDPTILNLLQG